MVSYYNSTNMYRHQQEAATAPMHSWYAAAGYHHQGAQMAAAAEQQMWEPQMWHHHHGHSVFNGGEFPDFVHSAAAGMVHAGDASATGAHTQLMPSPTVSGSEMSSPGAGSGNISPHQTHTRPPPARSPFEWIKKTSYQSQPNPGKTRTKDKYRVVYTDFQRIELEKEFMLNNRYITIRRKSELAANLGLSERQIKIWFQNRRAKERKQNKKRLEERMGDVYQQDLSLHHHHQDQLILGLPAPTPSLMMSMNSLQLCSENVTKTEINDTDNMV